MNDTWFKWNRLGSNQIRNGRYNELEKNWIRVERGEKNWSNNTDISKIYEWSKAKRMELKIL